MLDHFTGRAWYEGNEEAEEVDWDDFGTSLSKARHWAHDKAMEGLRGIVYNHGIEVGACDPDDGSQFRAVSETLGEY